MLAACHMDLGQIGRFAVGQRLATRDDIYVTITYTL